MEGIDLAAAVIEELVGSDRAADDLIEEVGGLAVSLDFGISLEPNRPAACLNASVSGSDRSLCLSSSLGTMCCERLTMVCWACMSHHLAQGRVNEGGQ